MPGPHGAEARPATSLEAAISGRLEEWDRERVAERLWRRDGSLWAASGKPPAELEAWLGWLRLPDEMRARVGEVSNLARSIREDGYGQAGVLGMGGSSLAPELFGRLFGPSRGSDGTGLELRVLDSTHPDAVRTFRDWATAARTIFCVSSKSGTTTEPLAFHAAMADAAPALDFVAITDPDTPLAELARSQEFRGIVEGEPDVGGRYSALSVFGLVPAALAGVDLPGLLDRAVAMADRCRLPAGENPGLQLGAAIGEAALAGRDKLTILTSPRLRGLADWAEQLVAESTGKQGKGIVPVVGEPIGAADRYGSDRYFVFLTLAGEDDPHLGALAEELMALGHSGQHVELADPLDVGGEFVRWEVATAAAGISLGIDPFDQPNVTESKDATRGLLEAYRDEGALPSSAPLLTDDGIGVHAEADLIGRGPESLAGALGALLDGVSEGDYLALLAYLPAEPRVEDALQRVRVELRDRLGVATTLGFGPRFLHSTGQLHKGGPASGVFLQLTAEPRSDLPIPGWEETFGVLVAAQALGDLQSLQRRGRRAVRLHLSYAERGLAAVEQGISEALAGRVPA